MDQQQLKSIIEKHELWLKGGRYGRPARLVGSDLSWLDLSHSKLICADLRRTKLMGANLNGSNLVSCDLEGADLTGALLRGAIGNLKNIKSICVDRYEINYTSDVLQIGCQQHPINDWWGFEDYEIIKMDGEKALVWWKKWKGLIKTIIEASPAEPTK